jgi:uncharacterized protein YndB with AHSA1/START domain
VDPGDTEAPQESTDDGGSAPEEAEMSDVQITVAPGQPLVLIERGFDAPLDMVVQAHLEPELLTQWLGPHGTETIIELMEVRDGGRWRYIHRDADGDFVFHGVFHGTPSAEGIVQTFQYEGALPSLQAVSFEEREGRTTVRTTAAYLSVEERDAMVEAGMAQGVNEGYSRLDELLGRLQGGSLKTRHD